MSDEGNFDGVVAVSEPVPGWHLWLHIAGGVGCPGAEGVSSDVGPVPGVRPVLPLVGAGGCFQLRRMPFAFTGQADLDPGHRATARPGLAADRVRSDVQGGPGRRAGDPRPDPHQTHDFFHPA